eukprot:5765794-Prymnesium_polylepis.1
MPFITVHVYGTVVVSYFVTRSRTTNARLHTTRTVHAEHVQHTVIRSEHSTHKSSSTHSQAAMLLRPSAH